MHHKSFDDPLVNTLYAKRAIFEALGEVWLEQGAYAFGVWGSRLLLCWPEFAWSDLAKSGIPDDSDTVIYEPIEIEDVTIGKIGVMIPYSSQRKAHLHTEALLISEIVAMKRKFEAAAIELMAQAQLKTEIDMAASIQLQLLDQKLPQIDRLDTYAYSNPATQVGGDFYDFCLYRDHHLIFAVGDISGKGLPAALIMSMTRVVLRTVARSMKVLDASTIVNRVNEDLYDDFTGVGMFATMFVGCYDTETGQLLYANAGHAPAIYCPSDGPAVLLDPSSSVVGIMRDNGCQNQELTLHDNDVLVIGTDGLNECINIENEMFGYERLLQTVKSLSHLSASQIGREIIQVVDQFAEGQSQFDDQTVMVIKKG